MNNIKRFSDYISTVNEAIIMPREINPMISELRNDIARKGFLSLDEANDISEAYGVKFIDYSDFYDALSDNLKHTAPPRNTPVFGFFREDGIICVVVTGLDRRGIEGIPHISAMNLGFINHIIQHESIHTEQWRRREGKMEYTLPDPKDSRAYFSNKDEIMAFSQSMIEMMMSHEGLRNISQLKELLDRNRLWQDIKKSGVSEEVKKRYLKYIYQYAEQYLNQ
jgi:hypothetical protein